MSKILIDEVTAKLALEALEKLVRFESDSWELGSCRIAGQATRALREALASEAKKPDFWEGYVPEPVKPAQPVPDAFEQLMREADKPTQVLQDGVAEYVDALVKGTHEITSVTIRPKRTWQGLTQEEFRDFATTHEYGTGGLIRAIEAKLRSKNEDRN